MAICRACLRRWRHGRSRNAACSSRLHRLRTRLPAEIGMPKKRLNARDGSNGLNLILLHSSLRNRSAGSAGPGFQLEMRMAIAAKKNASAAVIIQSGFTALYGPFRSVSAIGSVSSFATA